jgi:hypothetical protein
MINLLFMLALAPEPYQHALTQLANAEANASRDPEQATAAVLGALVELAQYPASVAADPEVQRLQSLAQLNLARSYLLRGQVDLAGATMDEAIRTAQAGELPAAEFGPSLESVYDERLAALEAAGRARLHVTCTVACRVFINEREASLLSDPMYLGIYRVWVVDESGEHPPLRTPVRFDSAGGVVKLTYRPQPSESVTPLAPPKPSAPGPRLLSRNVEIAMLALGVGLASVGTWMIAARELDSEGPAVIGIGGVAFLIGGVLLIVDEARSEPRRRMQTAITRSLRF